MRPGSSRPVTLRVFCLGRKYDPRHDISGLVCRLYHFQYEGGVTTPRRRRNRLLKTHERGVPPLTSTFHPQKSHVLSKGSNEDLRYRLHKS